MCGFSVICSVKSSLIELMDTKMDTEHTFASDLEICYEVLLYLSSRLARLKSGEVLEFITGDADAEDKITEWTDERDYPLLDVSTLPDGRHRFLIRKP
jgi:TusA-related sulfurtransferase